jgi:dGTPase
LTYATLASIAKYPCESIAKSKKEIHRKKFGFFQSEKQNFLDIAQSTQMIQLSEEPIIFQRHPFVWLVEAADDICYNIIDLEDAHRLGIISHEKCLELFLNFIRSIASHDVDKINTRVKSISNKNDRIAYLRAKTIHYLILSSIENFINNESQIFSGNQTQSIFDIIKSQHSAILEIEDFTIENIYNHRSVIEIENAGYNVMAELLSHFIAPIILNEEERDNAQKKAVLLIPSQFLYENESIYQRVMGVIDYVSGMTDNYATDLYRKIKGIDIGMTI